MKKVALINSFGIYTVFGILDKITPFLFLPVIARHISKIDMGNYILYQSIYAVAFFLLTLNTDSAILLNYYKLKSDEFKMYLTNSLMVFGCCYALFSGVLFFASGTLSKLLDFPAFWLQILLLVVVFQYFSTLKLNMWQVEKEPFKYGFFRIANTVCNYSLAMFFIFYYEMSWKGFILAQLITSIVFAIIAIVLIKRNGLLKYRLNLSFIKDNLKIGVPLTLHSLNAWLGNFASRIIINTVLGKMATGSYGIAATFGLIMTVLQESFNKAYTPYLFERLTLLTEETKFQLVKFTYQYYVSIILFAGFLSILGFFGIGFIFGDQYKSSRFLILPIVAANAVNGMYKMHINYLFYEKKTILIALVTFAGGVLNVVLCYFLLKKYGIIGTAYALLITQIVSYLSAFYLGNKAVSLPWRKVFRNLAIRTPATR